MKSCLLIAGLLLASTAQAQVRFAFGPQAGYTLATAKYSNSPYATDTRYRSGLAHGLLAEAGVGHLSTRLAACFTQKGVDLLQTFNGVAVTTNDSHNCINYLITSLNIGYTQRRHGQGLQLFAGGYLGFVPGGQYVDDYTYLDPAGNTLQQTLSGRIVAAGNNILSSDRLVRPTDAGVQAGLGYRYKGLLVQLEHSWGLRNVDPNDPPGGNYAGLPVYYNRVFQLSAAYLIPLRSSPPLLAQWGQRRLEPCW